jgi:hypothetical protein
MTSVSSMGEVMDFPSIAMSTPAFVIDEQVVLAGRVPLVDELRRILAGDEP